ncbi:MAG: hypothetical protein DCO81_07705 [Candidatus Aquiluna sp. XM-24bin5]|jgi:hypothetical protein|nr:MAG: hypothetical protein DCO81_07705 [Candidatus Aquiluna sp. XM-24bin5]
MTKSGIELGREHAARLEAYLAEIDRLPSRAGKPNMTAIARACGFDRQVLYKNPTCASMLEAALEECGLDAPEARNDQEGTELVPASKLREAEQRNSSLEKKISEMRARIVGLEALLRRREIIDEELTSRGRRSALPSTPLFGENAE